MEKPEPYRYIAIVRSSLEDGVHTDTLYDVDTNKKQALANKFLEDPVPLLHEPTLTGLRLRARHNNAELIAFASDIPMTFTSMDDYLNSMDHEDLQAFFRKHNI